MLRDPTDQSPAALVDTLNSLGRNQRRNVIRSPFRSGGGLGIWAERCAFDTGVWVPRYEASLPGFVLTVDGEARPFKGTGLRIKRQSIRRLEGFYGHCWQSALFPDGRAFGFITYPPKEDGSQYNEGYVFQDGKMYPARVVQAPWLRRIVGSGDNRVDTTYIDNAAQAHFDAFEHLRPGAACAGKAYFISNGEPLPIREVLNRLLAAAGAPPVTQSISFKAAYRIGAVCERLWPLLRLRGEPPMTRFLAEQLSTAHWYSMEPARRDFGYVPAVSFEEGLRRLAASL